MDDGLRSLALVSTLAKNGCLHLSSFLATKMLDATGIRKGAQLNCLHVAAECAGGDGDRATMAVEMASGTLVQVCLGSLTPPYSFSCFTFSSFFFLSGMGFEKDWGYGRA